MKFFTKVVLLLALAFSATVGVAAAVDDARFIAQREYDAHFKDVTEKSLKASFVAVYFRPISDLGIQVIDMEEFADLVPQDDIAPYVQLILEKNADFFLSNFTPEQLSQIAKILRASRTITLSEILTSEFEQKLAAEIEKATANTNHAAAKEPVLAQLEELVVQMEALNATLENGGAELFGLSVSTGVSQLFVMMRFAREIRELERTPDNPVLIAALKADGILQFANPVQRQTLIRQFSGSQSQEGIQFIRPPSSKTDSN